MEHPGRAGPTRSSPVTGHAGQRGQDGTLLATARRAAVRHANRSEPVEALAAAAIVRGLFGVLWFLLPE
jgi:hypothetical protein